MKKLIPILLAAALLTGCKTTNRTVFVQGFELVAGMPATADETSTGLAVAQLVSGQYLSVDRRSKVTIKATTSSDGDYLFGLIKLTTKYGAEATVDPTEAAMPNGLFGCETNGPALPEYYPTRN